MENKPRYSRISDILDLAIFMQSKIEGVTIPQIAERYNISRKTAERMRDSLMCIFPQIDEIKVQDSYKHWGFTNFSLSNLIAFTPEELASINQLKNLANGDVANILEKIIEKIEALNNKNNIDIKDKIELIMQTQGFCIKQAPNYKIKPEFFEAIKDSIGKSCKLNAIYHSKKRLIEPLGLIYGTKIYLVGKEKEKGKGIYNYLLHKFEALECSNIPFKKTKFDLQKYANLSFGSFHGEILKVKLSFVPKLKDDIINYNFHPTQKISEEKDGSITVKFSASGSKEIFCHLFKWGSDCKIVSPESLKTEYKSYLLETLKNYQQQAKV